MLPPESRVSIPATRCRCRTIAGGAGETLVTIGCVRVTGGETLMTGGAVSAPPVIVRSVTEVGTRGGVSRAVRAGRGVPRAAARAAVAPASRRADHEGDGGAGRAEVNSHEA